MVRKLNYLTLFSKFVYELQPITEKEKQKLQNWINEKNKESDNSNLIESVQRVSQFNTLRKNVILD